MTEHSLDIKIGRKFYRFHFQLNGSRVWVLLLKENSDPTKFIMQAISGQWESLETYHAILDDPKTYITMVMV